MRIRRDKTALRRVELSRPLRLARDLGLLRPEHSVFDYGCGHGSDVRILKSLGFTAAGWDPAHAKDAERLPADVVNLGFVVNVIEDQEERIDALLAAWRLSRSVLIVAARLQSDVEEVTGEHFSDGVVTRAGTFQHFYTQSELQGWLEGILEEPAVAVAPGIFALFRGSEERERFRASRFHARIAAPRLAASSALFAEHRETLGPLLDFFVERGRLPNAGELSAESSINAVFGSLRRAFAIVRKATKSEEWDQIAIQREEELLLYLAHSQFNRPPRFTELGTQLQGDIRAFYGNYTAACEAALMVLKQLSDQDLIDAVCRNVKIGKQTPQAVYMHANAVAHLPGVLRLYEACARGLVGEVEGANIVKLHRYRPQVSYLCYPDFDVHAHPALKRPIVVNLDEARASIRDYGESRNPPILHRKEEFLLPDDPARTKFARLTRQEERAGLYEDSSKIGFLREWNLALAAKGLEVRGHTLRRIRG